MTSKLGGDMITAGSRRLGPGGNEHEGRRRDIRGMSTCPVLPPNGCVTLGKLLDLPVPRFLHL